MRYIISDIHGCYDSFTRLLEKIRFSDDDELYVLGDLVDRGPEPMRVILTLMAMPNAYFILGNHDWMALRVLRSLAKEITEENAESGVSEQDLLLHADWLSQGGAKTAEQFRRLDRETQQDVLEYLEGAQLYDEIWQGVKHYVLVHAGLNGFAESKPLDAYALKELIFYRADYTKRYYQDPDTILVTGHTPVFKIRPGEEVFVYSHNGHLAIDCGCVYGEKLAAYCVEEEKAYYVDGWKDQNR